MVTWCAEVGSAHQGDLSLAYELIRKAKWAGATIAKFQLGWTELAQEKYARGYDQRRYIDHWAEQLNEWCSKFSIEFMASIWSFEGLEVARKIGMKRYKIAHQINDKSLTDAICGDGNQVFWSMDGSDNRSSDYEWGEHLVTPIYCQSEYPSYRLSSWLANRDYHGWHGYSSHMHGIGDALTAVARGANYIEKHITLDKTMPFPRDNSFAILPEEFRTMVDVGNEMAALR